MAFRDHLCPSSCSSSTFGVIIHPSQCSSEYIVAFPVTLAQRADQCEHVILDAVVTCCGLQKNRSSRSHLLQMSSTDEF